MENILKTGVDHVPPAKRTQPVLLSDILSNDAVARVAREHAEELIPHLPPTGGDPALELSDTVKTPQFRQAADTLGHAFQTGQLGPVFSQFGMDDLTLRAVNKGNLRSFARKLTLAEGGRDETPSRTRKLN